MITQFELDPRLAADSLLLAELELSTLRLMNDARFPWLMLVPRKPSLTEIIDLGAGDRATLMMEIGRVSEALKQVTGCDKLNVGALGNVVSQLHVHIVARRRDDPAWPGPVWGAGTAEPWDEAARASFVAALLKSMG